MLSCVVGGSAGSRQACVLAWRSAGSSGQLPLWRHQVWVKYPAVDVDYRF
jgi:hypothetical protein